VSNTKVTLGADPEFFVAKIERIPAESKGPNPHKMGSLKWQEWEMSGGKSSTGESLKKETFVPITGLLGGTKERPIVVPGLKNGCFMQEDGAAVEFNIPICEGPEYFTHHINYTLAYLIKHLETKGLIPLRATRVVTLSDDHLEKFPSLKVIGCDPDICAYFGDGTQHRPIPAFGNFRGAGGHIHIGYDKELVPPQILAKLLDIAVLLPLLSKDPQGQRRELNGLAGLYRDKPYGIEYRSLSNFWIWDKTITQSISSTILALIKSVSENLIEWQAFFNTVPWYSVQLVVRGEIFSQAEALVKQFSENKLYSGVIRHVRKG
jgi:hypothetical protein